MILECYLKKVSIHRSQTKCTLALRIRRWHHHKPHLYPAISSNCETVYILDEVDNYSSIYSVSAQYCWEINRRYVCFAERLCHKYNVYLALLKSNVRRSESSIPVHIIPYIFCWDILRLISFFSLRCYCGIKTFERTKGNA